MRKPSLIERTGERFLLLLVGPLDQIPALYARGRLRFALARAVAYATVMTASLALINAVARGPMFHAPVDPTLLALRLGGYWVVQFVVGVILSMLIWTMVGKLAKAREASTGKSRGASTTGL